MLEPGVDGHMRFGNDDDATDTAEASAAVCWILQIAPGSRRLRQTHLRGDPSGGLAHLLLTKNLSAADFQDLIGQRRIVRAGSRQHECAHHMRKRVDSFRPGGLLCAFAQATFCTREGCQLIFNTVGKGLLD